MPLDFFWQGKKFFSLLSKKEKILFCFLFLSLIFSFSYLIFWLYFTQTEILPKKGGVFKEAILGKARILNPIYATLDGERDLIEILFSGLLKYGAQGEILPDLAKSYQIKDKGKTIEFSLKDNLYWSDGKPLTVDDIIFTVKVLKDPHYKSPYFPSWFGINVKKISEKKVAFELESPYLPFLELATFKIIPKHIWEKIEPENFPFSHYNLKPVTFGPYLIEKILRDDLGYIKKIILKKNPYYYKEPYFKKVILFFYQEEKELLTKVFEEKIDAFAIQDFDLEIKNFNLHQIILPRYFALFFNPQKSEILKDLRVRKALNYATNKKFLLKEILNKKGKIVNSPFLPQIYGLSEPETNYPFDLEKAKELLILAGFDKINKEGTREKIVERVVEFEFKRDLALGAQGKEVKELQKCLAKDPQIYPQGQISGYFGKLTQKAVIRFQEKYAAQILYPQGLSEGTGKVKAATREKLNELCARIKEKRMPLELELVTVNQPHLERLANLIKKEWKKIGVKLKIKSVSLAQLEENHLKTKNYQILLFGQALGKIPDPYPFWHSEQKEGFGLNLANFENQKANDLIFKARKAENFEKLKSVLENLQEIILKEAPAIFLYTPFYLYFQSKKIKGFKTRFIVDPSKRFSDLGNWYSKTKRRLKPRW